MERIAKICMPWYKGINRPQATACAKAPTPNSYFLAANGLVLLLCSYVVAWAFLFGEVV